MATQKGRNWSSGDIVTAANLSSVERGVSAMAEEYTPTTWSNGDTVTAAALNNIEQGIVSGGSSDFSTAQVTIVNNAPDSVSFNLSLAITRSEGGKSGTLGNLSSYQIGSGMVVDVVLYKGLAAMELTSFDEYDFTIEASGDAQVMSHIGMITGDCTITISDSLQ